MTDVLTVQHQARRARLQAARTRLAARRTMTRSAVLRDDCARTIARATVLRAEPQRSPWSELTWHRPDAELNDVLYDVAALG